MRKMSEQFDIEFGEISKEISHPVKAGEAREHALRKILERHLPHRVAIDQGFVIDAQGRESKQMDIIVYDKSFATVFEVGDTKYFPCEIVLAVGEVKSDIDSNKDLEDALGKIKSAKELDRSNLGRNYIITGPGISITGIKFDPLAQHRDQILGLIFTRTSLSRENILRGLQQYNRETEKRLWLNIFCAYKNILVSYEKSDGKLTASAMDANSIYCTVEEEVPNLLFLFISILATFVNEAHIARPDYFSYTDIMTTTHTNHALL
jgi:hypothetical protein